MHPESMHCLYLQLLYQMRITPFKYLLTYFCSYFITKKPQNEKQSKVSHQNQQTDYSSYTLLIESTDQYQIWRSQQCDMILGSDSERNFFCKYKFQDVAKLFMWGSRTDTISISESEWYVFAILSHILGQNCHTWWRFTVFL